jgi:GT2 family glycosyltransferase
MPDVSVTLVLYNSAEHLSACLSSLRPELERGVAEVIAVDNASPDDSASVLTRELPDAKLIRASRNLGFAGACNLAWPSVGGRYWLLLNPDVELEPGAIQTLTGWMDAHPRAGVASAWLRDPTSEEAANPGREFPSITRTLLELSRFHRLLPTRERSAPDWVPGTVMIVRPQAVRDAGLLNESFFLYGEDLEWCWRIRKAGWEIGSCSRAVAVHHGSRSSARTWSQPTVDTRIARGILDACEKMHGDSYALVYGLVMALATGIEARHPRRQRESRQRSLAASRAWRRAALSGSGIGSEDLPEAAQDVHAHDS